MAKVQSEILDNLKILSLKKQVEIHSSDITMTWEIDPENPKNNLDVLVNFYKALVDYTYDCGLKTCDGEIIRGFLDPIFNPLNLSLIEHMNIYVNYPFLFSLTPRDNLLIEKIRNAENSVLFEQIKSLTKNLQHNSAEIRFGILNVLRFFIEENKYVDEIVEVVSKSKIDERSLVRIATLDLSTEIVKKGRIDDEAINLAAICIKDNDLQVREKSLFLLKEILAQPHGKDFVDKVIRLADVAVKDKDYRVQALAVTLYKEVVQKYSRFIQEAITMLSLDPYIDVSPNNKLGEAPLSDLAIEIVKHGKGFEEAIDLAMSLIKIDSLESSAYWLLKEIVRQGRGIDEAIEAANIFIQNDREGWNGLYLFREIIRQGFGFDEAIEAVNNFIEDPHYRSITYLLYAEAVIRRTFYNPLGLLKWLR